MNVLRAGDPGSGSGMRSLFILLCGGWKGVNNGMRAGDQASGRPEKNETRNNILIPGYDPESPSR